MPEVDVEPLRPKPKRPAPKPEPEPEPAATEPPRPVPPSNASEGSATSPQISGAVVRRRLRSCRPSSQAKTRTTMRPTMSEGTMGTKTSLTSSLSAVAARAVGPPHGRMFMVPLARPATQVRTTGLILSRRYTGSIAAVVRMKVVEPSPSKETAAARTAVPRTTLAGSLPSLRRMNFTRGSKSPTSIISPK